MGKASRALRWLIRKTLAGVVAMPVVRLDTMDHESEASFERLRTGAYM